MIDESETHMKAKKLIYELLGHVEDALLFQDVYWSVLEFAGKQYEAGCLCFKKKFALDSPDEAVVAVVDVYRLLLVVMKRVVHHWVHLSSESLAKLLFSTLQLLVLSPHGCSESTEAELIRPIKILSLLDTNAGWLRVWLHKAPASDQLFVALQESGFVAELLQYLSRVRPLEDSRDSSLVSDEVERLTTQHVSVELFIRLLVCSRSETHRLAGSVHRVVSGSVPGRPEDLALLAAGSCACRPQEASSSLGSSERASSGVQAGGERPSVSLDESEPS